jgi:hypothetical protein
MKRHGHLYFKAQAMIEYSLVTIVIVMIVFLAFKKNGGGVLEQTYNKTTQYFDTGTKAITGGYYDTGTSEFVPFQAAAVDGGWCAWSECVGGARSRECACPRPAFGGAACPGNGIDYGENGACGGTPACEYPPSGVYSAAAYYTARNCGHTPGCPTGFTGKSDVGGACWVGWTISKWRSVECGALFPPYGVGGDRHMCDGDPCVVGLVPQDGRASFHLGTYMIRTATEPGHCVRTVDTMISVNSAGYAYAGGTNYNISQAVASWGQ